MSRPRIGTDFTDQGFEAMKTLPSRTRPPARGLVLPLALGLAVAAAGCASDPYRDSAAMTPAERELPPPEGAASALLRVALATRAAGDYASAVNVLKRAHAVAPRDAAIAIELGETLAALGAHNEAREVFVRALVLAASETRAIRGLANVLVALSEPALAIEHYRAALAIRPEAATHNGLGVAFDATDKPAEAQAAYRAGLALEPHNPSLIGNLGLSLALAGRTQEAIDGIARELREGRATPRLRQNLALIYGLAGRMQDARAVLRIDLDEASIVNNIAYYEMLRGLAPERRREAVLGARRVVGGGDSAAAAPAAAPP